MKKGIPNQKTKKFRIERIKESELINDIKMRININPFSIFGAILTIMAAPVNMKWRIGMTVLFLLGSLHAEVVNYE